MTTPSYLPEAIPTPLGWAHPLTGEQLDVTKDLDDAVNYYKPNAGSLSFIDPESEDEFLGFAVVTGRKVKFAVHTLHPVVVVSWDFGDGEDPEFGSTQQIYVYPESENDETYTAVAAVTYVTTDPEDPEATVEGEALVEIDVTIPASITLPPAAPANTARPVVSGDARVGETLTATAGTWSGNPAPSFEYAWKMDGAIITGASGTSLVVPADALGTQITVSVTATNTEGTATAESNPTSEVQDPFEPPVNTAIPTIAGNPTVGGVLTGSAGTWSGNPAPTFTYQWQRGTTNIAGATGSTYTAQAADTGQTLRLVVTAQNTQGTATATSNATAAVTSLPSNTSVPTISGTATVGQTLTATPGTWTGHPTPTFTYQWQRGTTNIAGATASTYQVQEADASNTLRVVVTATNSAGTATANSTNTTSVTQAPANTAAPVVSGTATVGQTLSVSNGTWTGTPAPTFTYQWQRGSTNIAGATSSTYQVQAADAGSTLRVVVTATNSAGSANATSPNTASVTQAPANTTVPVVSGTAVVGETLTATPGTWTGTPAPTFTYQWQRGTAAIAGATSSTYTVQAADVANTLRVVVTATNSAGSASANSANTASVTQAPANTAAPAVSGTAVVGEVLTSTTGTWTGTPAPTFTYQWQRNAAGDWVAISGSTSSTHTLTEDDIGANIRSSVTGTNSVGNAIAYSNAIGPVEDIEVPEPEPDPDPEPEIPDPEPDPDP